MILSIYYLFPTAERVGNMKCVNEMENGSSNKQEKKYVG